MEDTVQIAIDLLSALLTGGFLLFFIETMHIEHDVSQRFLSIMNPFYHKLSKMTVFIGYLRDAMSFPETERGAFLKRDMDNVRKAGIVPNSSGRDIPYMKVNELSRLCEIINDIWYQLENSSDLCRDIVIHECYGLEIAANAIRDVYPKFEGRTVDIDLLHDSSGSFYIDFWQPVEHCPLNFEYWKKKARLSRVFIYCAIGVALLSMIITMLWAECICSLIPCALAVLSSILFVVCIGMMAYLLSLSNRLFRLTQ